MIKTLTCAALFLSVAFNTKALPVVQADVVIYGGTSGGIAAAIQTARFGKSVALVAVGKHIGGMTASGLGRTDIGNKDAIGGISREFYRRVGQHYGQEESWYFEPHVAEKTFNEMLQEANVPVYLEQQLASVTMNGSNIVEITMLSGMVFRARVFIDATYEGDLMARAGVTYFVGREGNAMYGETLNGVRERSPAAHGFSVPVDPYIVPGDPLSGLLPFMQPGDGGIPGEGDHRIQAYCFRMCLTQNPTNFIPIAPPANYDSNRYELLARYIEALVANGQTLKIGQFFRLDMMPNGKTDSNNNGAFSTDYIGFNYDYPEADYARRAEIWLEHQDYMRGFFHFLATSPRVPASLRAEMQSWGLAKDEFTDNGGWPWEMYVREARRMISDYVMTEKNCRRTVVAADSVGLGAYTMDSHNCQRIVKNGAAFNEGDTQVGVSSPYSISYRSIVPRVGECANLFVPVCLSASHIAFGSIRMEPVFMVLGQSAATAACFAIDDEVPVQQVDYEKLRLQLLADRQVLRWGPADDNNSGIIVDNSDATGVRITGDWISSVSISGFYGTNYIHDGNTAKGTKSVRFTPTIPTADTYNVYLRWTSDPNRSTAVPVDVTHAQGVSTFTVDQRTQNGQWVLIGSFPFTAGTNGNVLIRTTSTTGYVVADSVRFDSVTQPTNAPLVNVVATAAHAVQSRTNAAWFTFIRSSGDSNSPVTVNYTIAGTATPGTDYLPLPGSITIPAGEIAAKLLVVPTGNPLPTDRATVVLNLTPAADYITGSFSNATITIGDRPYNAWKRKVFTADELNNPDISGDNADPNHNGQPNLVDYAFGLDPKSPGTNGLPAFAIQEDRLTLTYQRSKAASDVLCVPQISFNLQDWHSGTNHVWDSVIADDGTNEVHVAQDPAPIQFSPMKFLRLKVTPF